ncbi:MAG: glycerol kinase GlpK [Actinobacteria bacterium]|nr:glycerol kinase GlpK [Actinomycetota bacterium]
MKKPFIVAIDQGTTSCRTLIYNAGTAKIEAIHQKELKQIYPRPGWVEHDANQVWEFQLETLKNAIEKAGISPGEIAGIGITNQRETIILWDRDTGKPVANAIVWQCRRTAGLCEQLKKEGAVDFIKTKTGLVVDAYFSAPKIKWMLDNIPGVRQKAEKGELLAGTMDTWLIWNLTSGRSHITDYTNASRTMLFNIHELQWDRELLKLFGIPDNILPEVVPSSGELGYTDSSITGLELPIYGLAGDQHAALFGQACFTAGSAKNTYGTGCFILMNTGFKPVESKNNLITTIAWKMTGKKAVYALEGSVFNAGSTLQWIRDEMKMVSHVHDIDIAAEKITDAGGVYIVPAFTGLGAPYWDMHARGIIAGLTRGTNRSHILRAALESIAYQSRDIFEAIKLDSGIELKELKADGGASVSNALMSFQADILGCRVIRSGVAESTAMGIVYMAGLAAGTWQDISEVKAKWKPDREFIPSMTEKRRKALYSGWRKAIERSKDWAIE